MGDLTYFANQYSVISESNVYTVTFSGQSKEEFETEEFKSMLDSFTIKNFQGVKKNTATTSKTMTSAVTAIILVVIAIGGTMMNKIKAKKNNKANSKEEKSEDNQ